MTWLDVVTKVLSEEGISLEPGQLERIAGGMHAAHLTMLELSARPRLRAPVLFEMDFTKNEIKCRCGATFPQPKPGNLVDCPGCGKFSVET